MISIDATPTPYAGSNPENVEVAAPGRVLWNVERQELWIKESGNGAAGWALYNPATASLPDTIRVNVGTPTLVSRRKESRLVFRVTPDAIEYRYAHEPETSWKPVASIEQVSAVGPTGATGPVGATGPGGPPGATGPTGSTGVPGIVFSDEPPMEEAVLWLDTASEEDYGLPQPATDVEALGLFTTAKFVTPRTLLFGIGDITPILTSRANVSSVLVGVSAVYNAGQAAGGIGGRVFNTPGSSFAYGFQDLLFNRVYPYSQLGRRYRFDFSREGVFTFTLGFPSAISAACLSRVTLGKSVLSFAPLAETGVGFEFRGTTRRVWLVAHNGTSLTEVDTGFDAHDYGFENYVAFTLWQHGDGTFDLYMNRHVHVGSIAGGPTAWQTDGGVRYVTFEGTNGADATDYRLEVVGIQGGYFY